MIPPIPPTPPQTGAPPPLGAPPPMAPPMGAPMPPSPMGKGIGSMLNTDPMARSNFSMMLSDIQNQAMIPPMPMHMNEGGLVGFIQNLLKGIGGLFRGGGGQQGGSGSLKDFERAFATARAKGLKTFPFDRDGDGVDEIYTTRYENEPIEGQAQTEKANVTNIPDAMKEGYRRDVLRRAGPERLLEIQAQGETAPTSAMRKRDSVADLLIQAQQSQTRGLDPKVPEGGRPRTEGEDIARNFANRLEQIKKEMNIGSDQFALDQQREQQQKLLNQIINRQREQTPDLSAIFEADQSKDPTSNIEQIITDLEKKKYEDVGAYPDSFQMQDLLKNNMAPIVKEGNVVDIIQERLEKLINVSGDQPNLPEGLTEGVKPMGLDEKIESLYQSGLRNIGNVKEEVSDLASRIKKLLGMNQGGSVTDAIAKLENGGEPEDEQFKQMLQNLIGGDIFDLEQGDKEFAASMGLTAASYPILKSLISKKGALNKRLLNPNFDLGGKEVRDYEVDYKPISKRQMYQNALKRGLGNLSKTPSGLISALTYLLSASPAGEGEELKEFFNKQIVNKNEGGAINASNLGMAQGMGMGMGMGSGDNIQRLLYPLTTQIHRSYMQENDSDIKKKLDEFTQQVDQLTKSTFPDVSFQNQNTGLRPTPQIGFGGVPTGTRQFGVFRNALEFKDPNASSNPFQNFVRTSDVKPNNINSLASSPFGNSLGSFFQDKFQSLQGYNTGGIVNPDRINEIMAVMNKYSVNGVLDSNNPDYKAEVKAIIDKYENMEAQGGDSQQLPSFLPGQQGDSPFAGTNLPPESLVNETATEVEDEKEPVRVFGTVTNQFGQADQYIDTAAAMKDIGYTDFNQIERLYYKDKVSGRTYSYDNNDKEFDGLGPGYYGDENVELVGGLYKVKGHDDIKRFDITEEDKKKYDFSGILVSDPQTSAEASRLQAKDDPSDNDLFYTAPNGQTYVDVTGTGQGIPVGSTDIHRKGAIETPKLEKTYDGYQAMGTSTQQELLDTVPKSGSFLDAFTPQSMGGKPFDLGAALGMDAGKIVFSNPPSNQTNLNQFFQNVQDFGGIENFLRSSQDKLGLLKDYNFTDLLTGNLPSEFLTMDGKLDEANINNTLNEYLSGTTASGDPSTTFGDSFNQISNVNTTNDGSSGSSGGSSGTDGGGSSDDDDDDNEEPSKTLFNFKDLYTNTEPMEDIIARTVVDSPVSSEGMGTFSPIDSSVVYNPDMFTDFSFPDPSDMTIRDNENPFEDDTNIPMPIVTPDPTPTPTPTPEPDITPEPEPDPDQYPTPTPDEPTPTPTPQPTDYSYLSNYNTLKEGGGAPDLALQTYERTGTVIPGYHGLISEYSGKPISELETFKVPDQQTNTENMNMGGMSSNGDVISKFLAMDIDKRPLSKTPKVADMSTLTASIKMNEGGEVTAGMNKAIDTFLASMM